MRIRFLAVAVLGLGVGCADTLTAPHTAMTPALDVLYSRIRTAGRHAEGKYVELTAASQGCLFGATHSDSTFQGVSVPRVLLPFHLPAARRERGKAGTNELATFTLAVPGGKGGRISVSCAVPSKGAARATLANVQIDPTNPKWHMILVGLAQRERHDPVAAPPASDEVAAVRREVLGYQAAEHIEAVQAATARLTPSRHILASADCAPQMQTERNAPNAHLSGRNHGAIVPASSPQVQVPDAPAYSESWTCSPGGGEGWMDVLVDAVGTWAAAWDYYDFAGLDLDNGTTSFADASAPYYGTDPDMLVDPQWNLWPDEPYYDPTNMPDADAQDAYVASSLICGSKCLTVDEFHHSSTVQSDMQALYNMSMSDPQHREYGAYLWRDSQGHIHMDQVFTGTDPDHVDMGIPPGNSIAGIHTHPTLGVVGYGDSQLSDPPIDPADQWVYENFHEIGVVVTQHREIYYRPSDGTHPAVIEGNIWAPYPDQ